MFIPPFIPFFYNNNDKRPIDRKKALLVYITLLIEVFVFLILFVSITWFDFNIFKHIPTNVYFVLCFLFGFLTPILVTKFIK